MPQIRKLLFAGKYAEAQKLAKEKMMGDKKVESSYQTLGDILIDFALPKGDISDYRRELDIDSAVVKISFRSGGILFNREAFSSAQHLWEHYLFTEDKIYLSELAYPVMKEAAEFCAIWLVENPVTKQLVSGPSISPENTFKTKSGEIATMVMGPTMDHMIIRDLLINTIEAGKALEKDAGFRKRLETILSRLAPTKVASDGRIMEWTEEFEEPEPGHRHISHLFGLYP